MFKDIPETYSHSGSADLSIDASHSVVKLLAFVDKTVSGFRSYYLAVKDSDRENRISDFLVYYFNTCISEESEGFPPLNFGKNPTQAHSAKETDIGVVVLTKGEAPVTIIEFEAKRLSKTSNNKEYVCGERGGIERFKRSDHGSHLSVCGMFGYIQCEEFLNCAERVNGWITELGIANDDPTIDWTRPEEKLAPLQDFTDVTKWSSINLRSKDNGIQLLHYFINLSN